MSSAKFDIGYLSAGVESLEDYLTSNVLFWPIHAPAPAGERAYPRLTLGGVLLSQNRLAAQKLDTIQAVQVESVNRKIYRCKYKWKAAWEKKAARELSSRIRQWRHYLQELSQNPEKQNVYYRSEVNVRVIIELLIPEFSEMDGTIRTQLLEMDAFLRANFSPGPFIWEQVFSRVFNENDFWFLWGLLRLEDKACSDV